MTVQQNILISFSKYGQQIKFYKNYNLTQTEFPKMMVQMPPDVQNDRRNTEQQYNSFLYKFEQQIIDAWKPVPYTSNNVILYSVLTTICLTLGLVLILTAPRTQEIQMKYSDDIQADSILITKTFQLTQTLAQPIYLYYGLTNYYQNHRRYLKYFSPDQMSGKIVDEATAKKACGDAAYTNAQIGATTNYNGSAPLDPNGVAFPCGQRAKSYLKIKPQIDTIGLKYPNGTLVTLNRNGVSWPDDSKSYRNSDNLANQAISNADEAWLVWYRPAARNTFFKLHSKIQTDLPAGTYSFVVQDKFNASSGEKWFHLSKSNYVGNRDNFLGIAFLVLAGGCLVVLVIFIAKCVTERRGKPKST